MWFHHRTPTQLVELFTDDLTKGIANSGVRAGTIKVATDHPVTTTEQEVPLRAVALAHRETGTPITTHSDVNTRTGLDQQRVFESEGVDLSRVVIGHCGDTTDLNYLSDIMAKGSSIGMDRFGLPALGYEERVATIVELCQRGFGSQMVLSHDASNYSLSYTPESRKETLPDWNYLTVPTKVVPELRSRGVDESDIRAMTVDNPRRVFEQQGGY